MLTKTIEIVDRGRGMQLSTSRITVQDLVPYFIDACSHEEIMRWIPTLTVEEIEVVHHYFLQHEQALRDEDRLIRERANARRNPSWVEEMLTDARAERKAIMERLRQSQANGLAESNGAPQ